jgi:hypothetical protein
MSGTLGPAGNLWTTRRMKAISKLRAISRLRRNVLLVCRSGAPRGALALGAIALLASAMPAADWAALPGANGRIAFTRNDIGFTIGADGSDERRLGAPRMSGPEWSPDGSHLVFNSLAGSGGLYVANADGSGRRLISRNYAISPTWSPDGSRIAYISSTRIGHVVVVNADGSGFRRRLTNDIYSDYNVSWSPDGHTLAFLRARRGAVFTIAADGTGLRRLVRRATGVEWSPDGKKIAYSAVARPGSSDSDVWVAGSDGNGAQNLTAGASSPASNEVQDGSPQWSPDGTKLLFTSDRTGEIAGGVYRPDLYVMNADGSGVTRLARGSSRTSLGLAPSWQPLCTSSGTSGDDRVTDATGALICLRGGSDTLTAGDGDEHIFAGPGRDSVLGGLGDDVLSGGNESDRLDGGAGEDLLAGDLGRDRLIGGLGADDLHGGPGGDDLRGGEGDDWLAGDSGSDVFWGGGGDDKLYAKDGRRELVVGGPGFDTAYVDRGLDRVRGVERVLTVQSGR